MKYLGIEPRKPKIAIFDFTSCEGCELQLINLEKKLPDFLRAVEIVNFRVASSSASENYEIAFVEGAVSRYDEVKRLGAIREKAEVVVSLGSCACFGGVNRLKNETDLNLANREVYDGSPKETLWVKSIKEIVDVDMEIPGCPVSVSELEAIVRHLVWETPFTFPVYPVCVDCKQRFVSCLMDKGMLCLGPVTRGGCDAPCPAGGLGCWGCRGPATDPNYESFFAIAEKKGFSKMELQERLNFFGGFGEIEIK